LCITDCVEGVPERQVKIFISPGCNQNGISITHQFHPHHKMQYQVVSIQTLPERRVGDIHTLS